MEFFKIFHNLPEMDFFLSIHLNHQKLVDEKGPLKKGRVNQFRYSLTTHMKIENNEYNNEKNEDDDGYFALSLSIASSFSLLNIMRCDT